MKHRGACNQGGKVFGFLLRQFGATPAPLLIVSALQNFNFGLKCALRWNKTHNIIFKIITGENFMNEITIFIRVYPGI